MRFLVSIEIESSYKEAIRGTFTYPLHNGKMHCSPAWFVEIETLDDLLDFTQRNGEMVIGRREDGEYYLEKYEEPE